MQRHVRIVAAHVVGAVALHVVVPLAVEIADPQVVLAALDVVEVVLLLVHEEQAARVVLVGADAQLEARHPFQLPALK
jgi:hypothetical protein